MLCLLFAVESQRRKVIPNDRRFRRTILQVTLLFLQKCWRGMWHLQFIIPRSLVIKCFVNNDRHVKRIGPNHALYNRKYRVILLDTYILLLHGFLLVLLLLLMIFLQLNNPKGFSELTNLSLGQMTVLILLHLWVGWEAGNAWNHLELLWANIVQGWQLSCWRT